MTEPDCQPAEARVMAYVTCADAGEARRIAATLLEENLIACANVLPVHTAVYRWQGTVREEPETAMLLKTRAVLLDRVARRIAELHSYEVPCVVGLPITGGHAPFLRWIGAETGEGSA